MYYQFQPLYIGTLVESRKDGVYYVGEVLCSKQNNQVLDLIRNEYYDYVPAEDQMYVPIGHVYVMNIKTDIPNVPKRIILTKQGLLNLARQLNKDWAKINIDDPISFVRRIK